MSIKSVIFKNLATYLIAQIPTLQWVDLFRNQPARYGTGKSDEFMVFPAVLIEFQQALWETGNETQRGDQIIRIHVCYESYAESYQTGTDVSVNQDAALAFLDWMENLHQVLQKYSTTNLSPMVRMADTNDANNDMIHHEIIDYHTILFDDSTAVDTSVLVDPANVTVDAAAAQPVTLDNTFTIPGVATP